MSQGKQGLSIFLVLNEFAGHFRVQAHCVYAVTFCPEVISPVGLLLEIRELLEHSDGRAPLERAHLDRDRHLWRHHTHQVDVIRLNAHLDYLASKLTTENMDAVVNFPSYTALQHGTGISGPTRRDTDNAIWHVIAYGTCSPASPCSWLREQFEHRCNRWAVLRQSLQTLPTSRGRELLK